MGIRVAYGKRENVGAAISDGTIPKDCIIITKPNEGEDPELLFYDANCNLITISERDRFASLDEAKKWIEQYVCCGNIVSVNTGEKWVAHIVQDDKTLSPVENNFADVTIIDGGTSST